MLNDLLTFFAADPAGWVSVGITVFAAAVAVFWKWTKPVVHVQFITLNDQHVLAVAQVLQMHVSVERYELVESAVIIERESLSHGLAPCRSRAIPRWTCS